MALTSRIWAGFEYQVDQLPKRSQRYGFLDPTYPQFSNSPPINAHGRTSTSRDMSVSNSQVEQRSFRNLVVVGRNFQRNNQKQQHVLILLLLAYPTNLASV
jgi:hypothetical protein